MTSQNQSIIDSLKTLPQQSQTEIIAGLLVASQGVTNTNQSTFVSSAPVPAQPTTATPNLLQHKPANSEEKSTSEDTKIFGFIPVKWGEKIIIALGGAVFFGLVWYLGYVRDDINSRIKDVSQKVDSVNADLTNKIDAVDKRVDESFGRIIDNKEATKK